MNLNDTATPAATPQSTETEFQKWDKLPEPTGDEAESSATDEGGEADEPEAKKAPVSDPAAAEQESDEEKALPNGLKKRFRELTTKVKNLQSELAASKTAAPAEPAKAEPAKAEPAKAEPAKADPAVSGREAEPQAKDYPTYEAFSAALIRYELKQERIREAADKETRDRGAAWQTELKAARERHADFDSVALSDMPINAATHEAIVAGGKEGAELAYYLGQNRDEAAAIFRMSPLKTALALGKIIATFDSEEQPAKPAAVSRAPRPARTVTGSAGADLGKEPDPKDFRKWNAWKDKQEAAAA